MQKKTQYIIFLRLNYLNKHQNFESKTARWRRRYRQTGNKTKQKFGREISSPGGSSFQKKSSRGSGTTASHQVRIQVKELLFLKNEKPCPAGHADPFI